MRTLYRVTGHQSEGALVQRMTGPKPNPNPNPNPYSNVLLDLMNNQTLNSFSYVQADNPFRNSD